MKKINVEIKAFCGNLDRIRKVLKSEKARFEGKDHQIDTYFKTQSGRLKLRQGNIENYLISYYRENQAEAKVSKVTLYDTSKDSNVIKEILSNHIGILCIVDKKREIYFINNIKIHLDYVRYLGTFVEIEACSDNPEDEPKLREQTEEYKKKFEIKESDLIDKSYSDMILEKKNEL